MVNPAPEEAFDVSVIIPAHNEEKYVCRCLASIRAAAAEYSGSVETVVVCNRCTDRTEAIAAENGAVVVLNEARCIAAVRNAGIRAARGKTVLTMDCDNRMTPGTIREAVGLLDSGKYIGGGAPMRFERYSFPLRLNDWMCRLAFRLTGLWCGIFWARKETFLAVGGFREVKAFEDADTARALKKYGKSRGKKYGVLKENHLINSTRKFDDLGDWLYFRLMFRNAGALLKAAFGKTEEYDRLLDELFYDYNDRHP
ncbi:MAG: glycosyltransferase [Oscillospiraceae bacterium]|nr:glycosyltransferase [Oscillospiraceae bacterium]